MQKISRAFAKFSFQVWPFGDQICVHIGPGKMRSSTVPLLALLSAASYTVAAAAPCFVSNHVCTNSKVMDHGTATCPPIRPHLRSGGVVLAAKAKSGGKKAPSAGGFGAKSATTTKTVDAGALLTKSIKLYDELSRYMLCPSISTCPERFCYRNTGAEHTKCGIFFSSRYRIHL